MSINDNDRNDIPGLSRFAGLDPFDIAIGGLHGLPDVVSTRPTTIQTVQPIVGRSQSWIVQTFRQKDKGDTVFLTCVSGDQHIRIALPPKVSDMISRQRDAVTGKARKKAAKAAAQDRKDRGILPGFMLHKKDKSA